MQIAGDDREAFIQTGYQQPTTEGIKKYGKRLIDPSRVHEYVRTPEEFRAALARAYKLARNEKVSSLINCQAIKEFTSPRDYPPGISLNAEPGTGAVAR